MSAEVIELNRYKETVDFNSAIDDRKRVFLKILRSAKIKGKLEAVKEQLLVLIGFGGNQEKVNSSLELYSTIFGMSNIEFAILRSILDGDYSLLGYEKLSNTEQKNFILKCTEVFNEEGNLILNAYVSYCKRKIENYDINNFGDD